MPAIPARPAERLGIPEKLAALGALWTAREIEQQQPGACLNAPTRWSPRCTHGCRRSPRRWRMIPAHRLLAGAGTSAYIGECPAPLLIGNPPRADAIPTTDIVGAPALYLDPDRLLLLVSFGRSGNSSPESPARSRWPKRAYLTCATQVVTCNANGDLASHRRAPPRHFAAARGNPRRQLRYDLQLQLHAVPPRWLRFAAHRARRARIGPVAHATAAVIEGSARCSNPRPRTPRSRGVLGSGLLQGPGARGGVEARRTEQRRGRHLLRHAARLPPRPQDFLTPNTAVSRIRLQRSAHPALRPRPARRTAPRRHRRARGGLDAAPRQQPGIEAIAIPAMARAPGHRPGLALRRRRRSTPSTPARAGLTPDNPNPAAP